MLRSVGSLLENSARGSRKTDKPDMALSGRLALVTGGATGIGEAVCHALAAEGATVVVANRNVEAARKVAESLPGDVTHMAEYVDVGDSSSVEKLFDNIRKSSKLPLSIVVHSAANFLMSRLVDCTDELFDDSIRVNLRGTFLVTRAAGREMMRSGKVLLDGGAAIVNIASVAPKSDWTNFGAYHASKAGVVALTKTAAQEFADHGIRCNVLLPGLTETPAARAVSTEHKARLISMTPLKRSAEPREIAEAVKFLCSPASFFITGAALDVSGGLCM